MGINNVSVRNKKKRKTGKRFRAGVEPVTFWIALWESSPIHHLELILKVDHINESNRFCFVTY